jgi:hypothetical protein
MMGELRDRKVSAPIPHRGLGAGASKRGTWREQEPEFLIGLCTIEGSFACGEQGREFDQRRRSMFTGLPQERPAFRARFVSARTIKALPHRSGAESPIAPNRLLPAAV